ncbi:MAG: hypothetical protein M0Z31_06935 [Clostridia bacterium]|nr:hypothetical protein [Clostridia bacterium]
MKYLGSKQSLKSIIVIILAITLLAGGVLPVWAAVKGAGVKGPKVVMVMVNRVSYPELRQWDLPNLGKMAAMGGQGLMTVIPGAELEDRNAYASIGAGTKTFVPGRAVESYNGDEEINGSKAVDVFRRNSGLRVGEEEVVQVSLAAWLENTKKVNQPIIPGGLGEVLQRAGKRTAVIGNSDLALDRPEGINRLAPLVAMDGKGRVDLGTVGRGLVKKAPLAPGGLRTDYQALWQEFNRVYNQADLLVIETGDTVRLEAEAAGMTQLMREMHRREALVAADAFIGKLLPLLGKETMLMVVTPLPPGEMVRLGEKLTPLFVAGGEMVAGAQLATLTTRHHGVVTYYDLSASILDFFGLAKMTPMLGLPVYGWTGGQGAQELDAIYETAVNTFSHRGAMVLVFVIVQVLALVALLLPIIRKKELLPRWYRPVLISLGTGALAMLLLPLLGILPLWVSVLAWLGLTGILALLMSLIRGFLPLLFTLGLTVFAFIFIDVALGTPLMRWSFLGYDVIVGGRFYGIGNEYMGVLIGASIITSVVLLDWRPRLKRIILPVLGLVYTFIVFFFAAPNLGTNAGGALAAVVAYAVTMYRLLGWNLNWRVLGLVSLVAVVIGVIGLVVVNKYLVSGQESHIGRAAADLLSGNFDAIIQTMVRKASANWYLIVNSVWNKLVAGILITIAWIYYRYRGEIEEALRRYPSVGHGLTGIAAGAVAALVFNDSGIISLATMSVFMIIPLYCLVRRELQG